MTDPKPARTRRTKTPAQRAQDLYDAAVARLARARGRLDHLKAEQTRITTELRAAEDEVKAAEKSRDHRAGDPDLPKTPDTTTEPKETTT